MRVGQTRKRDDEEMAIVDALRAIGVEVIRLNGPGVPDLLTWRQPEGFRLVEVKAPKGHLTPEQERLQGRVPVLVARTRAEALALFGVHSP